MKPGEPTPPQKPKVVKIHDDKPVGDKGEEPPSAESSRSKEVPQTETGSNLNSIRDADSDISGIINDEILRSKVRKLAGEQPPPSAWQRVSTNPLISVFLGFLLTGLLGGFLTYYYTLKLKELELQRAEEQRKSDRQYEDQRRESDRIREDQRRESDRALEDQRRESDRIYQERQKELEYLRGLQQKQVELLYEKREKDLEYQRSLQRGDLDYERTFNAETNRIRVQKIGEVWEEIDRTESQVDAISEQLGKGYGRPVPEVQKDVERVRDLISEQATVINKNRFWLGEEIYNQITTYLDIHGRYTVERILGKPDKFLGEAKKKREQAKQNILAIRRSMLSESGLIPAAKSRQPHQ